MSERDAEIERLKAGVSCAALLERLAPVWQLDRAQSTRHSLKYRRGAGLSCPGCLAMGQVPTPVTWIASMALPHGSAGTSGPHPGGRAHG